MFTQRRSKDHPKTSWILKFGLWAAGRFLAPPLNFSLSPPPAIANSLKTFPSRTDKISGLLARIGVSLPKSARASAPPVPCSYPGTGYLTASLYVRTCLGPEFAGLAPHHNRCA